MPPETSPFTRVLLPAAFVAACLAMAAEPLAQPALLFICKPLTTLLLIAWAWPRGRPSPPEGARRHWLRIGLMLSLVGDVALLWPERGFLPGLVSFLLAHLAYIVAFTRGHRLAARPLPFAAYALIAAAVLSQLWPSVPAPLRLPVLVYVAALACMAAQAASVWLEQRGTPSALWAGRAAVGGALFMLSDATLATNKFAQPLPMAGVWILSTYWLAQAFIAASLRRAEQAPPQPEALEGPRAAPGPRA
ncbi:lysoplasmalogenase [Ideonella sp. DXS29W]|uniref:Lysoplasmalogenase n=1 Tax=Ideonella lacteola TaxID=2984193 RepID=A0ABU9BN85_9BURK